MWGHIEREYEGIYRGHTFQVRLRDDLGIKYRSWVGDLASGPLGRREPVATFGREKWMTRAQRPDDSTGWTLDGCCADARATIDELIANGTIKDYS